MAQRFDYFAALDGKAMFVPALPGGPTTEVRLGLFGRKIERPLDTVQTTWIDPDTVFSEFEAILSGLSFDEDEVPDDSEVDLDEDDNLRFVDDETRDMLADIDDNRLPDLIRQLMRIRYLDLPVDPVELESEFREVIGLARRARERVLPMYCFGWWSR